MTIIDRNVNLYQLEVKDRALGTKEIILEHGKAEAFRKMIVDLYPEGLSTMELNDLLYYEDDFIFEQLGIIT